MIRRLALVAIAFSARAAYADVNTIGAYTTRIDVEVPPYHGIEPQLALVYSSSGGDGLAGVGWQLQAGSTIVRASPGRGAPRYDANDIYLLDGMELIPCQQTSTSPSCTHPDDTGGGTYFSTKIESFRRIKLHDNTWFIWDGNGRKTTLSAQRFGSTSGYYRWATVEVRDMHENHVDYGYKCDPAPGGIATMRECYLERIRYGHGAWVFELGGLAEVELHYQDRPDPRTYAMGSDHALVRKRLQTISVRMSGEQVRAYRLQYSTSSVTGRSLLASVQQFGRDAKVTDGDIVSGTALPIRTFETPSRDTGPSGWSRSPISASTGVPVPPGVPSPMVTPYASSNWIVDNDVVTIPADVNGDGRTDFIYPMIYKNSTLGIVNALSFSTAISGDGAPRFVDDYFTIAWPAIDGAFWATAQWFAGDYNNDRNTDIYMVLRGPSCHPGMTPNGNGECPHAVIAVAVSKGDGTYDIVAKETDLPFERYHRSVYGLTISAYAGGGGGGAGFGVGVGLTSGGGGFGAQGNAGGGSFSSPGFTLWYNATVWGDQRWAVGDANGDGRDDVMVGSLHDIGGHNYEIGLTTALATEDTFDASAPEQMTGWITNDTNVKKTRMFVADVNGDARADWMVVHDHEANRTGDTFTDNHVALNVGHADPSGTTFTLASVDGMGPWEDGARWLPSDVDGDGRADFVRIGEHEAHSPGLGDHAIVSSYLSEGTGLDYREGPSIDTTIRWNFDRPWCTDPAPETMWFGGDYDGDGRGDIMGVFGTTHNCAFNGAQEINQGFLFARDGAWVESIRPTGQIMAVKDIAHQTSQAVFATGDVNGDGTTDLLFGKAHTTTPYDIQRYDVTTIISPYQARDTWRYLYADITGDGRQDLVLPVFMNPGYRIITQIQQSDGSFTKVETGSSPNNLDPMVSGADALRSATAVNWMIADVGGPTSSALDGKADLVYVAYPAGVLRIYTLFSVGDGSWVGRVDHPFNSSYPRRGAHSWRLMNANGDGRPDLVNIVYDNGLRFDTFLARGDGTWIDGRMEVNAVTTTVVLGTIRDVTNFRAMDVNGDGRDELVHVRAVLNNPSVATEIRTFYTTNDPDLWDAVLDTPAVYHLDVNNWAPMDLDGDGAVDLATWHYDRPTNRLLIDGMLSRGNGTWSVVATEELPVPEKAGDLTDTARYRRVDTNGDGLTDLVHIAPYRDGSSTSTGIHVLEHVRSGWRIRTDSVETPVTTTLRYRTVDLDADGSVDLAATGDEISFIRRELPSDRLAREVNGIGASTGIAYRMATDVHSNGPPGLLPVVESTRVEITIPALVSTTTVYAYDRLAWSRANRSWIGFGTLDARDGEAIRHGVFETTEECGSRAWQTTLRDAKRPVGQQIIQQSFYDVMAPGTAPYACLTNARLDVQCEGTTSCQTTSQRWEYDEYGNAVRTYTNDLDGDITDDRMSERPVIANRKEFLVELPSWDNTYRCATWSPSSCTWQHMSSTVFEYDDNVDDQMGPGYAKAPALGELRRVKPWDNRTWSYPATQYEYDASGNMVQITEPEGKVTSIGYDWASCSRRYHDMFPCAIKVWNPSGPSLESRVSWDAVIGKMTKVVDPNGQPWQRTYDVLGRTLRTSDPTGGYTELSYLGWGGSSQRVRTETRDNSAGDGVLWSEAWFDGLSRVHRTKREGVTAPIYQDATFHELSAEIASRSNEYDALASRVWTTFERDVAARVTAVVNPDASRRTRFYEPGAITATDERGKEIKQTFDTLGRIIDVRETLRVLRDNKWIITYPHTTYTYDAPGPSYGDSVDTITDDAGNLTRTTRDSRARTRESCDPDRGCRGFAYRDDNTPAVQVDAKGQIIEFRYDLIGRLVGKDYRAAAGYLVGSAQWSWDVDPSTNLVRGASAGRVTYHVDSRSQAETSITYDASGRTTEERLCVRGICGTGARGYDIAGRVGSVRYPDSELVTYEYDAAGELARMPGYMPLLQHGADGNESLMCLGDGTCTKWSYDSVRSFLVGIDVMKVSPGQTSSTKYLERATFIHDAAGLLRRWNTSAGATTIARRYGYDSLGRLVGAENNAGMVRTYSYDSIGNMTNNSAIGAYTYDPAHAHAVQRAGSLELGYDANGNEQYARDTATNLSRRETEWDFDNRPWIVWSETPTGWTGVMFGYDANGSRVSKQDASGATTLYFGHLAERDTTGAWINYYYAGNRRIAQKRGASVTYYHADHLGSPRMLTDAQGNVVKTYELDPFGAELASTGSGANNRTFTGAVADDEVGLIYMNARSYDPKLGRFISADNIIPNRYDPQTLNRYTYTLNSPLSMIDPSGHHAECVGMELCQTIAPPPRTPRAVEKAAPLSSPPLVDALSTESSPGEWAGYSPSPSAPPMVAGSSAISAVASAPGLSPSTEPRNGLEGFVFISFSKEVKDFVPVPGSSVAINELEAVLIGGYSTDNGVFGALILAGGIKFEPIPNNYLAVYGGEEFFIDKTGFHREPIILAEGGYGAPRGLGVFAGVFEAGPDAKGHFQGGIYLGVNGSGPLEHFSAGVGITIPNWHSFRTFIRDAMKFVK